MKPQISRTGYLPSNFESIVDPNALPVQFFALLNQNTLNMGCARHFKVMGPSLRMF